jgi:peptide/nickel transport system permease protein
MLHPLPRLLVRRAAQAIPLLVGVVTLTFVLIHAAPGDPVYLMAGDGGDAAYYKAMRARYGLDRPLPEQYLDYLKSVASGDFGFSFAYQQPVFTIICDHLPATLLLTGSALVLAAGIGLVVGVAGAAAPGSRPDVALRVATTLLYSMPVFFVGQLLLLAFASALPLFPVGGMRSLRESTAAGGPADLLSHLALPVTALTFSFLPLVARITRASVLVERSRDYVRAARARGVSRAAALVGHALPNALVPIVSITGHHAGMLLTGAGLTEAVFAWPGLGQLLLEASTGRDYPLIIAILLTTSFAVIAANVISDVACAALDPRVGMS